ncbi:3'-5' exonuclease, partial [Methylomonas sp. MgM2]
TARRYGFQGLLNLHSLALRFQGFAAIENYRSSAHIVHCANRVIAAARDRMKAKQAIRVNHARKDQPDGGEWAAVDSLTQGRVHILETPGQVDAEAGAVCAELMRLNRLAAANQTGYWGRFAVIARHWDALEPLAALCRQSGIPVRLMRDQQLPSLHSTREGYALISLLSNRRRKAPKPRVVLRWGALPRWFRRRYR